MDDIGVVKIPQSLNGVHELGDAQRVTKYGIVTYKFKVIASVAANVLHNVAVGHPFRDRRKLAILEGVRNPDKIEDVWVGQVFPHCNFFTEALCHA